MTSSLPTNTKPSIPIPGHIRPDQRVHYVTGKEAMRQLAERLQTLREKESKRIYLLTVTYSFKKGEERTARSINWHFERAHRRLLHYLAGTRNYHREWFRSVEPMFYGFVEPPSSKMKSTKKPLHVGNRDSTLHHHVIVVADAVHEDEMDYLVASKDPVATLFGERKKSFAVRTIEIERVEPGFAHVLRVVDYASEWALQHFNSQQWDDYFLVFPKTRSESVKAARKAKSTASAADKSDPYECGVFRKEEKERKLLKARLNVIDRERFDRERLKETGWLQIVPFPRNATSRLAVIDALKRIEGPALGEEPDEDQDVTGKGE